MKPRALLPCVFVSVAIFFLSLVFHRQTHPLLDLSSSLSHIPHTLGYSIGILALNFPFLPKIFHLFFFFFFPLDLSELVLLKFSYLKIQRLNL